MLGDPKAVTFSGPTYISIRSGKQSQSTAYSHAKDLDTIMDCDEFSEFCKTETGGYKPIVMITSDGDPDENPRFVNLIFIASP